MTLDELTRDSGRRSLTGLGGNKIIGVTNDSRDVRPGYVFFAVSGAKSDGHRHIKEALASGAVAIISELEPPPPPVSLKAAWVQVSSISRAMGRVSDLFYGHPSQSLKVFGVTGTNGKTTTTYLLESVFSACGAVTAVAGTVNYRLRGKVLEEAVNTTPVAPHIHRLLAQFRDGGATHVAMEVSSHALAMGRVDEIDFDAAVFTNFKSDHLDFHRTREEYFKAKARLFEHLERLSSTKKDRIAVINGDDPAANALKRACPTAHVVTYGLGAAMVRAENVRMDHSGTRFDLVYESLRWPAEIRLIGEHNIYNSLAAAAAALGTGLEPEGIVSGLSALACVPGRLEKVPAPEGRELHVFVDYAHTDSALETVLSYLRKLPHGRIITVFGCGGDRDKTKRGPMGAAACDASDLAVVTSDNPRSEDPLAIIADIEKGLISGGRKNYKIESDRRKAIEEAIAQARPGDIVLIAGKGHETYQILKDKTIPFDDRQVASDALSRKWNSK